MVDFIGWMVVDEKCDSFGKVLEGMLFVFGEFLVFVKDVDFLFGFGKGDEVVFIDLSSIEVDFYVYENIVLLFVWVCCFDGIGVWVYVMIVIFGVLNDCLVVFVVGFILINEVDL